MGKWGLGVLAPLSLAVGICLNVADAISAQALDYLAMYAVFWVVWRVIVSSGASEFASLLGALAAVATLVMLQAQFSDIRYMPYLLVIPANFLMAWFFVRNLVSDRSPILVDLIKIMGLRPVDPTFHRFVEGQCLLWSVMSAATAIVAAFAMVWADSRPTLAGILLALVAVQIVWFALSHYYASFRYDRPETWSLTLRTMIRRDVWARLGFR